MSALKVGGIPGRKARPLLDRIAEKVALTDSGCLVWLGQLDTNGYGRISTGSKRDGTARQVKVHRALFEMTVTPVPDGLDLDHLCRNRACAMPTHLEPVTRRENLRRGVGFVGQQLARNHCSHGHLYTPANTYIGRDGARVCRACKARQQRERRARRSGVIK